MKLTMLVVAALLASCSSEFLQEGNYYFLRHKGAVMPLWVKGNIGSEVLIVTVHGGPGDSGHEFPLSAGFKMLEQDYAVAYWDQRFSGLAQGDPHESTLTVDQFVEDVDKMVELIRFLYPDKKLFMLGHSWGGGLSSAYLGRDDHHQLFSGWICMDGSLYDSLEVQEVKRWILERVPARLAEGHDPEFWQYIVDWYAAHPEVVYSDVEPYIYLSALGGDIYDYEKYKRSNPIPYAKLAFASPFSLSFYTRAIRGDKAGFVNGINFTPELENITIPALLLWGREDGISPLPVGEYTYSRLGTPDKDKELVVLEKTAHSPHYETPEEFYLSVRNFVEELVRAN